VKYAQNARRDWGRYCRGTMKRFDNLPDAALPLLIAIVGLAVLAAVIVKALEVMRWRRMFGDTTAAATERGLTVQRTTGLQPDWPPASFGVRGPQQRYHNVIERPAAGDAGAAVVFDVSHRMPWAEWFSARRRPTKKRLAFAAAVARVPFGVSFVVRRADSGVTDPDPFRRAFAVVSANQARADEIFNDDVRQWMLQHRQYAVNVTDGVMTVTNEEPLGKDLLRLLDFVDGFVARTRRSSVG
jgi:hypothetical protein